MGRQSRPALTRISASIVLPVILLTAIACSSTFDPDHLLDKSYEPEYEHLPGVIVDVEIADAREDTTSRELDVPTFSLPWDDDEVHPTLTTAHREFIESEIRRYFVGGDDLSASIVITKGTKRFTAQTFSETEGAEFELTLDLVHDGVSVEGSPFTGGAVVATKSFDASSSTIDDMYLKVIAASIGKCIKEYSRAAQRR